MQQLTKAQDALLKKLAAGAQIVYRIDHYVVTHDDNLDFLEANIWPSTFYGLFDTRLITRNPLGGYDISKRGREHIA